MLIREVGLQLFSLHEYTERDFRGTVEKVAQMGYRGVEFAGYGGLRPSEVAQLLKDNGLEAYGSHIGGLPKTGAELDAEIEMNLAVGSKYLVCPWQDMATRDDALRFAEVMNETAARLRPHGLRLGYHNHDFEFRVDRGEVLLDTVLKNVEIGAGVMDFEAIIAEGRRAGVEHFVIEQEEYTLPPMESCKRSLDNLLGL